MNVKTLACWESSRGDDWWWTTAPHRAGSLNPATSTFYIDEPPRESARVLLGLLARTAEQFQGMQIVCAYDDEVRALLDQLQREGELSWSDAGNPNSRYAQIVLRRVDDPTTEPLRPRQSP